TDVNREDLRTDALRAPLAAVIRGRQRSTNRRGHGMQANLRTVLVAVALITPAPSAFADVIADWNEKAIAFVTPRMTPPAAQRVVAMAQVPMFAAVNSIERRYRPSLVQLPAPAAASKEAAAAAAAGSVLAGLHPPAQAELKAATTAYLSNIPDGDAKAEGIRLGEAGGAENLEARGKAGADGADAHPPEAKPRRLCPAPVHGAPMWPNVKAFAMTSPSQFRPEPPIALNSEQWANDYNEIKELGAKTSSKRSVKQTEDARFWLITGPQATDPVARQLAAVKGMNVIDNARFMALTAVALADAYIAVMDAKYHYHFWRPITAIRNGDTDDNPATETDATWQPIDNTHMHPEYPCAHCIGSAALAAVGEAVFGTADIPEIAVTSSSAPGVTHRWTNLRAYADEVAYARIWAGFHYRFSARVGQDMGRKIGEYVVNSVMQPAPIADAR